MITSPCFWQSCNLRVIAQSAPTTLLTLKPKKTSHRDLQRDDGLPSWVSVTGKSITLWLALWWPDWPTLLRSLDWPLEHTVQKRTGGFTTKTHVETTADAADETRGGHLRGRPRVPASGKKSSQPGDQSDHQSRLCLICLTRGSRVGAAISPSPEVLQINRHQKCPRGSSVGERFLKKVNF